MMNVKKIISLIMLLFMLLPLGAQNSEGKQRYKIAACDWMMLKRQKIGSFQLMKELGGDGIEMDMGGLGKRDTFDNKFHQPHFCKLFKETAQEQHIEVPSVAMSGFFGQSFLTHHNYKALVQDCLNTMKVMGAQVAFLPLGGIKEDWTVAGDASGVGKPFARSGRNGSERWSSDRYPYFFGRWRGYKTVERN